MASRTFLGRCSPTPCSLAGTPQPRKAWLWPSLGWMGSFRPHSAHRPHRSQEAGLKSLLLRFLPCLVLSPEHRLTLTSLRGQGKCVPNSSAWTPAWGRREHPFTDQRSWGKGGAPQEESVLCGHSRLTVPCGQRAWADFGCALSPLGSRRRSHGVLGAGEGGLGGCWVDIGWDDGWA